MRLLRWWHVLIAYVVAIVGFAGVYWSIAGEFYHPYVKFEPSIADERQNFTSGLLKTISKALGSKKNLGNGVDFQYASSVEITGARDYALMALLNVGATLTHDGHTQLLNIRLPILVGAMALSAVPIKPGFVDIPPGNSPGFQGKLQFIYVERDAKEAIRDETILPHSGDSVKIIAAAVDAALKKMQLTKQQLRGASDMVEVEKGFPANAEGTFARMLYFSAVTITTVGYGDIVPLGAEARAFAAIEATLGILLLGLFVSRLVS